MIKITLLSIVVALSLSLVTAVPVIAGPIKDIDITLADDRAGATTDYEISFTPKTGEATAVSIDFSAFGTTGIDMILSAVSTNISDYLFTGFSVNPTGVVVNDTTKIITFTGGTTTKDTEHTIINSIPGTGLVITNDQDAETKKIGFSTASDSGDSWLAINPGAIDHYSVSNVSSPQVAGTPIAVTIQAQDQFDNDISDGTDAVENITISFGEVDTGATPTSTVTNNGKVTVDITMTVAQTGQSVTFTGDTSGKVGTSNNFDVNPGAIDHYSVSNVSSPQVAGTPIAVTIQAQDQYNNDITSGADAAETVNITFGLADAGATPTSTTTANGTAMVNMTMTVPQAGQTIIFTGATSTKTGTSNAFTVLTPPTVTTNDASNIGVNSARLNGNLDDLGTAASVDVSFEWGETSGGPYPNETTPQAMSTTGVFSFDLSSLTANTTYYFRAKAVGDGTSYGTEKSFTTSRYEEDEDDEHRYYYLEINALGLKKRFDVTVTGRVLETIDVMCSDGVLNIDMNKGTVVKDKYGNRLRALEIAVDETPPAPPDNTYILGLAYSLLPDGTTFDPPMTLTWSYVPNALPKGAHKEELFLASYDENAGGWVKLDCVVDVVNHTIAAEVSHSMTFAALGSEPKPASFPVNNLIVSPDKVNPGESVTISVSVVNTGDLTGSYKVTLRIDDMVVNVEEVAVPGGTARNVVFELSKDIIGSYSVDVNGLSGSFIVEGVVPTPPELPNPPEQPTSPQPPTPPSPPAPKGTNWLLIIGITVAVVIVGSASYFFALRRRKA